MNPNESENAVSNEIAVTRYPADSPENYPSEDGYRPDDDGTMPQNVRDLADQVVGHRIVKAEQGEVKADELRAVGETSDYHRPGERYRGFILTLDSGVRVFLSDTSDCCAFTELKGFLAHPERVDHIITGVASTDGYTKWHIYADLGDVLELQVDWSEGNPFYYGYGFDIYVSDVIEGEWSDGSRQIGASNA